MLDIDMRPILILIVTVMYIFWTLFIALILYSKGRNLLTILIGVIFALGAGIGTAYLFIHFVI